MRVMCLSRKDDRICSTGAVLSGHRGVSRMLTLTLAATCLGRRDDHICSSRTALSMAAREPPRPDRGSGRETGDVHPCWQQVGLVTLKQ